MYNRNRIELLSDLEIDDIYSFPLFNEIERSLYFEFTDQEWEAIKRYHTVKAQIHLMISLGYFKAKQQFYKFDLRLNAFQDVQYILKKHFDKENFFLEGQIDHKTFQKQRNDILTLFDYQDWSSKYTLQIESHICELLRYYPKGRDALRQSLDYFDNHQIIVPTYRKLQDMFSNAFSIEEKRLNKLLLSISKCKQRQLSELINRENGISQLNIIRADQKNFQYTAVKTEVEKAQRIADLYEFTKNFIPTLKLSKNAIRYYADITEQYAASRLRRLNKPQQWLHAICFIYHRYQQIMDNLITSFMYHTRDIMDAGKTYAEIALINHNSHIVVNFPKLAQFLKWFPERDQKLGHDELNKIAYNILPEEQFSVLATFLEGNTFDKKAAKWEFYLKSARMFSLYLRPIVMAVPFVFYKKNSHVMELINLLKTHYGSGKSPSMFKLSDDLGFTVPRNMTQYLKKHPSDKYLDPYLFEFFVYQKIYHYLDRGKLCCNDSVSYCDINCDLVDDKLVDNVEEIAAKFGYLKIPIYCDRRLDNAVKTLDNAWDITTENIRLNQNIGFNLKETKGGEEQEWSLLYDSSEKLDDSFFKTLPKVEIADVMMFIGNLINMWDGFTHIKDRYIKRRKPIALAVNACTLSEAFGFGEMKMAEMSDLEFNLLRATREDFIRVETLCAVSDIVNNHTHSLPIFKEWNLLDDKLLADADGQKFSTSESTIQSRFSKKYLGKGTGISLYSLIANFVLLMPRILVLTNMKDIVSTT